MKYQIYGCALRTPLHDEVNVGYMYTVCVHTHKCVHSLYGLGIKNLQMEGKPHPYYVRVCERVYAYVRVTCMGSHTAIVRVRVCHCLNRLFDVGSFSRTPSCAVSTQRSCALLVCPPSYAVCFVLHCDRRARVRSVLRSAPYAHSRALPAPPCAVSL